MSTRHPSPSRRGAGGRIWGLGQRVVLTGLLGLMALSAAALCPSPALA